MSLKTLQRGKNDSVSAPSDSCLRNIHFRAIQFLLKKLGCQGNDASGYQHRNRTNRYDKPLVRSPFSLLVRVFNTGYKISNKARVALRANQFFIK